MSDYAATHMRVLRRVRRRRGYCADCGIAQSETYVCADCREKREFAKVQREQKRLEQGLCLECGKHPIDWINISHAFKCSDCSKGVIIRKLKNNEITNKLLYDLMVKHQCTTMQLAEYVGCSQRAVERWLFEGSQPQLFNALEVCHYFGVEIDEVFPQVVRQILA
ncbi:hypothetical protein [Paenibacillus sp. GXUN7292]|uniref:hypothetical protein n=1 Tax=Paenibacillus sp. GXUN7292 TaxID=3422499 RepID=UPI003D7CE801